MPLEIVMVIGHLPIGITSEGPAEKGIAPHQGGNFVDKIGDLISGVVPAHPVTYVTEAPWRSPARLPNPFGLLLMQAYFTTDPHSGRANLRGETIPVTS
jgi:hypothetical protein